MFQDKGARESKREEARPASELDLWRRKERRAFTVPSDGAVADSTAHLRPDSHLIFLLIYISLGDRKKTCFRSIRYKRQKKKKKYLGTINSWTKKLYTEEAFCCHQCHSSFPPIFSSTGCQSKQHVGFFARQPLGVDLPFRCIMFRKGMPPARLRFMKDFCKYLLVYLFYSFCCFYLDFYLHSISWSTSTRHHMKCHMYADSKENRSFGLKAHERWHMFDLYIQMLSGHFGPEMNM